MKNPYGPNLIPRKKKAKKPDGPKFVTLDSRQLDYEVAAVSCLFNADLSAKYASRVIPELIDDPMRRAICRAAKKYLEEGSKPLPLTVGMVLASANGELLDKDALPKELRLIDECVGVGGEPVIERAIKFLVERRKNTDIEAFIKDAAERMESGSATAECVRLEMANLQDEHAQQEAIKGLQLMPASKLGEGEKVEWLLQGYIAPGLITLFVGLWKVGKSTFIASLLKQCSNGGCLIDNVKKSTVLVVSEESDAKWARRRNEFGFGENILFLNQHFRGKPSIDQWVELLGQIGQAAKDRPIDLVIFDTLAAISPIENENDAPQMRRVLTPLHQITKEGAAVFLVHHPRKGGGAEGTASRGSGDLTAFVDIYIEYKRFLPEVLSDTRRTLVTLSREDETRPLAVIDYAGPSAGFTYIGDRHEVTQRGRVEAMEGMLPHGPPGITIDGIREHWEEGDAPTLATVKLDLAKGIKSGRYSRTGAGKKGDPFSYFIADFAEHTPTDREAFR